MDTVLNEILELAAFIFPNEEENTHMTRQHEKHEIVCSARPSSLGYNAGGIDDSGREWEEKIHP